MIGNHVVSCSFRRCAGCCSTVGSVGIAPKPDDFPKLHQAMGDFLRGQYDYSAHLKKLTTPTMLIFGDRDIYRPEHIVEFTS